MADTIDDITLDLAEWVDVFTTSGFSVGSAITVENHSSKPVYLFESATKPATPTSNYLQRYIPPGYQQLDPSPGEHSIRTISAGAPGLWALGSGKVNVSEGTSILPGGGGSSGGGATSGASFTSPITPIASVAEVTIPAAFVNNPANYFILHFLNNGTEVPTAGAGSQGTITLSDNGVAFGTTTISSASGNVESRDFDISDENYTRFNTLTPMQTARLSVTGTSGITHIQLEVVKG